MLTFRTFCPKQVLTRLHTPHTASSILNVSSIPPDTHYTSPALCSITLNFSWVLFHTFSTFLVQPSHVFFGFFGCCFSCTLFVAPTLLVRSPVHLTLLVLSAPYSIQFSRTLSRTLYTSRAFCPSYFIRLVHFFILSFDVGFTCGGTDKSRAPCP